MTGSAVCSPAFGQRVDTRSANPVIDYVDETVTKVRD